MRNIDPVLAITPADPEVRAASFLKAYADLKQGADVEIIGGIELQSRQASVSFRFNNDDDQIHAFTTEEARDIVRFVRKVFKETGTAMPNLKKFLDEIMTACDEVEEFPQRALQDLEIRPDDPAESGFGTALTTEG